MRNHIDSLKTRYSPAGDDNDDCSFTECQPTVYQKAQSHTNYQQYPSESNNNNSNDKNLSSNHSQYKPHVRRLLPHTKSFDDHDGFDLNDHQIDNSNGNNDDFCAADNNYDDQMNYFYHYQDYKRQNEPPVNFKDHWLQNGVPDLNWNKDQKNFIPSSSNRRPTSLHKSRVFSRRPRTRSIPRQHPTNANFSPYHNNTSRRFSRGHSLDYTHQHLKQSVLRNSTTSLLNDTEYHDIDPTSETKAIIHLTDELFGLRQGLKRTREANSERLEVALRHISLLELELQRQRCLNHDAEVARQREVERTRWEKRLAATLNELKYCQTDIGKLREQVDQLESSKKTSDQSELKLERQRLELDQTKATLDAQKEEITNLNNLLNSLLGLNPNDVSPNDLQRLQVGLLDLHKHMQPDCANQYCHYQRQQHVPNSINPRQTRLTGVPANERMNRVDWLNPNNTAAAITQSSVGNHQLYCNVPEHHDLEDCLGQLQYRIEELCDQHEITQNKLRHNMKIRRKLECQLEEQDSILNRLKSELMSCQEDLKIAKQEVTRLSCEKETAQKSKHEQLTGIVTDLANLEATVSQRRAELSTLDTNIQDSDQQLSIIKAQAKEAVSKYEEAKREYDNVKSQLDMIRSEKSLADENLEQLRTKLSKTKIQVERLESNKSNLENQLTQLEDAVNTKKLEYNQLLPNLSELETRLTRTQHDIEVGAERIRSDQHLRLEDERLSATRQAELTRLARQSSSETLNPQELDSLRMSKDNELHYLDERLRNTRQHLESVESELSQKSLKLNEVSEKLNTLQNEYIKKERIKSNSPELEKELEKCKQQQIASRLDDRNKQPTYNQFNDLKIDNVTKLHDNNSNLLQALMDTKSALIAAQRESKRLKRRTAREVAELERVAEEQCNRAGDLTEQLSLAKRQYAQLKSQITTYGILMDEVITIASQTELTEHGKRLEAALSAVRAELEQHNNTMNASVVDENACSNSILFGQRIREVLNPDSDSRIVKDRSSNDHEIQEITDHNYTVNGLQKSLLLLTNSFHEINHSPNNFHNVQSLTDSLNGLCKKSNHFSHRLFVNNNDSEHIVDDPELNYTTSGLGSSVNPGTQIASNSGSVQENSTILSPSTLGESKPVKSNNWKQNVSSSSVGRQRSHEESASLTTSGFVNHSRTPRHFKSGSSRSSRPG
ncbi:unnamed protein product [Schistosoma rodhaini]|nr:unnamed protein product [Schistosoma rodhaini]